MADKPSRALVVYGDGLAPKVLPSHESLHYFASMAVCGFLTLRDSPPSETEDERTLRDFAQLLDAYEFYLSEKHGEAEAKTGYETLSERFTGLRAAIFTSSPSIQSFSRKLGICILHDDELIMQDYSTVGEVPGSSAIASKLLQLLGFSGGDVLEKYDFDVVFLHAATCEEYGTKRENSAPSMDVNGLNDLIGKILGKAPPGSITASRLHISVVLSYGYVSKDEKLCSLLSSPSTETNSDLSLLFPSQSYVVKGGRRLNDIRNHHSMFVAQYQEGLTRRDKAKAFYFEDFKENGANLAILADRFLHEIAFRVWKAPKYGA